MLLTLTVVSVFGYEGGTVISVLLFAAAFVLLLTGIVEYINSGKNKLITEFLALLMCGVAALNFTLQLRYNDIYSAGYEESEGYAVGTIIDTPGYDGTYRYVIRCEDGFTYMLNTTTAVNAQIYDKLEAKLTFTTSTDITTEEPVQAYARIENIRVIPSDQNGIMGGVYKIRQYAINFIDKNVSQQSAALIKGVLLGDESAFSKYLEHDFSITGLAHLLVVSGSHLTMFVVMTFLLLPRGICRRKIAWGLVLPMILYMLLCGMGPSVVRSGICSAVLVAGYTVKKDIHPINSLGVASMLTCIIWPQGAVNIGFLLSFYSSLGMILFCEPMVCGIDSSKLPKLLKIMLKPVAITLSAQIFITLLLLICYTRVAIVTILSNLIIGAMVSLLMAVSGIAVLLAATMIAQPIARIVCFGADILSQGCIIIVNFIAKVFKSNLSMSEILAAFVVMFFGGAIILIFESKPVIKWAGKWTIIAGVIILLVSSYISQSRVVVTAITKECIVIRYKDYSVTVGDIAARKESVYLSNAVYSTSNKATTLLDVHHLDRQTAGFVANCKTADVVIVPDYVSVDNKPYVVSQGETKVRVADNLYVTAGENYTCVDMDGYRFVVAQKGADISHIKNIDCIIALGECKGKSKSHSFVTIGDINMLDINAEKVYNARGNEYFDFVYDRYFGILQ